MSRRGHRNGSLVRLGELADAVGASLHGLDALRIAAPIPAIALPKNAAAAALGMSVDSFERYVMADVRCIRRGSLRLYPVGDLERWADQNAERLLDSP
jgi:hypothetical protein